MNLNIYIYISWQSLYFYYYARKIWFQNIIASGYKPFMGGGNEKTFNLYFQRVASSTIKENKKITFIMLDWFHRAYGKYIWCFNEFFQYKFWIMAYNLNIQVSLRKEKGNLWPDEYMSFLF